MAGSLQCSNQESSRFLKSGSEPPCRYYEFDDFRIDAVKSVLLQCGIPVPLPPKAFEVLLALVRRNRAAVTKNELLSTIWPDTFVEESNLTQYVFLLRRALGEASGGSRYILTLPKIGYRFAADIRQIPERRSPASSGLATAADAKTIAILPFEALGDDACAARLGVALAQALAAQIVYAPKLILIPAETAGSPASAVSDLLTGGRRLDVDLLIAGTVQKSGDRARACVQLVDVRDRVVRWAGTFDEHAAELFTVQDSLAERIAAALQIHLSGAHRTTAQEVHQCCLKGRYFWNQRTEEGFRKSIRYFEKAIELEPSYAQAYVGLADCYSLLAYYTLVAPVETYPKAIAAVRKALALNPTLAEAHATLALAEVDFEWHWPAAEAHYLQAISLNPGYAMAHDWYAEYLAAKGRHAEAMAQIHCALELDPYSVTINRDFGFLLYTARRYEEAVKQLQDALEMDQSSLMAHCFLAGAYEQINMPEAALRQVTDALAHQPESTALEAELAYAYAKSGRPDDAIAVLRRLEDKAQTKFVSPCDLAMVYAALNKSDRAFHWLDRACEARPWRLVYLNVEPRLDPLRADPRFTAIAARMGLQG